MRLDGVGGIVVNGATATAVASHHMQDRPGVTFTDTVVMLRENGTWKVC
ncbi:Rv0361 family membrane protein [Gordonia iterans]